MEHDGILIVILLDIRTQNRSITCKNPVLPPTTSSWRLRSSVSPIALLYSFEFSLACLQSLTNILLITHCLVLSASEAQDFHTICRSNMKYMYWSITQQLAHHTINGCNLRTGDLAGTGTLSGLVRLRLLGVTIPCLFKGRKIANRSHPSLPNQDKTSFGSLLELTWSGANELEIPRSAATPEDVIKRKFIEDGDAILMTGWCEATDGSYRIGFGDCVGTLLPWNGSGRGRKD